MEFDQLGPYRIVRRIGRGGMGTVYQGTNVENGHPAAIKVLSARLAVEEGFRERFETEIETLKKLKHPNIVRLYGFGEQAEHLYYAMELVEGTNLEDELQAGRRFTWRETTQLGIKLARALKHAHDHGVIHRDLKPANLLLTEQNDIKLADFGIARLFGNTRLTSDGGLIGTAEYMAPEQADGRPVTFHCDLYSLGGVLFAMLAGRPPFRGASLPELLQYHRFSDPPRVSRFAPDVPDELDQMILRLLSKDPQARATNAMVIAKQLAAMEHALSLPQTRIAGRGDEELPEGPEPQASDEVDALNAAATERRDAGIDDDFSINMSRTLADPNQDPEATEAGSRIVERSARDMPGSRDARLRPDSAAPTAAEAPLRAKSVRAPSSKDADRQAALPGAASRNALAGDGLPQIASMEPVSRFTTVEQDEQRRADERRSEGGPVWAQIAALAASLVIIIGLGWYFMRPPSADALFQRIETVAADEKTERLLDAEDDIRRFLARFPDDPRGAKLKTYLDEIDLLHLERRVQRLPRQLAAGATVAPIQRDYVEAISLAGTAPQRAVAKLQAMLEVYGQTPNPPETTAQFLELCRRKLKQLEEQSHHEAPDHLAVIDAGLREAEKLRAKDPSKARAIWSGIVELYADKPWAADRVARAKTALSESADVVKSGH
jgi:eukaryotic-like serine/threonine-protein kinase